VKHLGGIAAHIQSAK